jgi:tetratricopeptide (TPR) repeat protein
MKKLILLICSLIALVSSCAKKIEITPATARRMIIHRNLGLAYLEENKYREATAEFQALIELAPREPMGYANLGLAELRLGQVESAEKWLQEAVKRAPDHPDIRLLLARAYEAAGREREAIRALETSLQKNSTHVRTLYQLAQYYLNAPTLETQKKAEEHLTQVVNALPGNVAAYLKLVELSLQNGKPALAVQHMETIRQILPELPEGAPEIFQSSLELLQSANTETALTRVRMFHNILKPSAFYQAALTELLGTSGAIGDPVTRFTLDVSPYLKQRSGIPDALRFTDVTAASGLDIIPPGQDDAPPLVMAYGDYDGDGDQDVFISKSLPKEKTSRQYLFANDRGVFSDVTAKAGLAHAGRDFSARFADYDNDGFLDLFITNDRANKLYHNTGAGFFRDVTAESEIRTNASGQAVFADLDHDGDLDILIAAGARNLLYRNNSDGTFVERAEEAGLGGEKGISRDVAFGDFDDDGDTDVFVAKQNGGNRYYDNLRQGYFRDITAHTGLATAGGSGAIAVGDYNNDGYFDFLTTDFTGKPPALFRNRGGVFEKDTRSDIAFENSRRIAGLDAAFFDADNDGFLDLLIAGTIKDSLDKPGAVQLFYNDGEGKYLEASSLLPPLAEGVCQVQVTDYDNDGDLDIFLASVRGRLHLLRNAGGNVNNYLVVRLAGLRTGSGKNNYFGIGAKLEVKAGGLHQVRMMNEPIAHFGLGGRERAELVRVIWSNGVAQNWLNPERNQTIVESQILKGSCPWLYAWNGERYEFVTDVLWTSALGMPLGIMGKEIGYAFPNSGRDYFKISGEMLQPRNGQYSLQLTSELWEATFVDRLKLLVVDHPERFEIFVDEKFSPPPYPALRVYAVTEKRLPLSARDDKGNDLLPKIAQQDGEYVSNFAPAKYQGITAPHDLILNLGDLSHTDSIFLFLQGWIFPTDASINVNTAQSNSIRAVPPLLQVIDAEGNWKTVIESMGFPKGKNKTMVFDLSGKFPVNDYRIRIHTTMQIYWDHIFYATGVAGAPLRIEPLEPMAANLHYRGFSEVARATPYSPHLPDYRSVTTAPKWRDLTGLYTRYGEVQPLLLAPDDQYVIMNAGDELTLAFDAARIPAPPAGWKRDFIFYTDGWVKDGDFNTAHGQTVAPLPFHGMTAYPYGSTESYPKGEEHIIYLQTYNTRKITAEAFKRFADKR